jgi:hypothetical protein
MPRPARKTTPAVPWSVPPEAVLPDRAAELAEGQEHHPVGQPRRRQIVEERGHRPGELGQQAVVGERLVGVRVVAGLRGVEDARPEVRLQQPGDDLQPASEPGRRVGRVPAAAGQRRKATA